MNDQFKNGQVVRAVSNRWAASLNVGGLYSVVRAIPPVSSRGDSTVVLQLSSQDPEDDHYLTEIYAPEDHVKLV